MRVGNLFSVSGLMGAFLFAGNLAASDITVSGDFNQPIIFGGGNLGVTLKTKKLVFEYSHGWALQLDRLKSSLPERTQRQDLKVYMPYSTGLGVGWRLTRFLDIRLEFKEHAYRVTHPDNALDYAFVNNAAQRSTLALENLAPESYLLAASLGAVGGAPSLEQLATQFAMARVVFNAPDALFLNSTAKYRTRSVGLGLYYQWYLGGGDTGWMIEPNLKFWPVVWSSLKNDKTIFINRFGLVDVHRREDIGLVANVTLGYTWKL